MWSGWRQKCVISHSSLIVDGGDGRVTKQRRIDSDFFTNILLKKKNNLETFITRESKVSFPQREKQNVRQKHQGSAPSLRCSVLLDLDDLLSIIGAFSGSDYFETPWMWLLQKSHLVGAFVPKLGVDPRFAKTLGCKHYELSVVWQRQWRMFPRDARFLEPNYNWPICVSL